MSAEQFVVITGPEDEKYGHVPFVAPHLDRELIVVDPVPAVIAGRGLSYFASNEGTRCVYNDRALDRVAAVWDRRPTHLTREMLEKVDPAYRQYSASAVREHVHQLYTQFPDALWVSDFYAVQRAEHKVNQLAVAAQCGFSLPETVFTSDPEVAKDFVRRQPATIIKGQSVEGPAIGETLLLFFSTRVTPESAIDYSHLNYAPAIFQRAIDVDHDVRITIVGDEVFPAAIKADAEVGLKIGVRDWRIGNYEGDLSIEACRLPQDIEEKCRLLVKTFGLKFGIIDMVVDKKGKYWFLEINPNGQWGFVEEETKQPIGKAMARLLLSGSRDK